MIREAERALAVMARITPYPHGSPAWKDYRARFLERYSLGAIVPLRDLADPDTGLGYAYVTNRLGVRLDDDPREVALRRAVYDCAAAG